MSLSGTVLATALFENQYETATILARAVLFYFVAKRLKRMYLPKRKILQRDGFTLARIQELMREIEQRSVACLR